LLVGEAPGYKGARWTGIPFTSEAIVLAGIPGIQPVDTVVFRKSGESSKVWGEATATIVWQAIREFRPLPLLWNAYPLHPHDPGKLNSNRQPTRDELKDGESFLRELIELFTIEYVLAVGNKAYESLGRMGIDRVKIRHPANGGKPEFVRGLRDELPSRGHVIL
jgi:uracil-DNA glycosylase